MKIISPGKWMPCDGIVLETNAEATVRKDSSTLVVAGPGAGKTELLAQKASYLFQTNKCRNPQKILAISFKNDAADNLKKRVMKRCGNEVRNRFVSLTYDAFSKDILDHFRFALPELIRPSASYLIEDKEVIDAAFKKAGFTNPYNLSPSRLNTYYNQVLASVTLPFSKNDLGEKVWKFLLKGFDKYNSSLSFKMICILSEYIIRTNPKIKKGLQLTYGHVFLDEFQDTTSLQYKLVKQCFLNSSSIMTAVGDNKQRIMLWAGALKTVFENFQKDFNASSQRLIMNHRSAPRLIELQKMMYLSLNESDSKVIFSNKWNPEDGAISLVIAENEMKEAQKVAADIFQKISMGISPNELCILCKQLPQKYTSQIILELEKYQIRARIENDYQDLIKEPIIEMLMALLRLSVDRKRPQDWEFILTISGELWGMGSSQEVDSYYKMQDKIIEEINSLNILIKNVSSKKDFHELLQHAIRFWGLCHLKAMIPKYNQGTYLTELLSKFQSFMWDELENVQFNWLLALENFEGLNSVPIMTIHKSKGLEYQAVYFVGLEDSAFWNFKKQPEEDRCAFFVALSRAKLEIMFTFCNCRSTVKYPKQSHKDINEFFELLKTPGIAKLINLTSSES
ncbi:MAG: ATP-dependent helicase [Ruminococcus flavefaciens]|nr:ATP-dependent helicase [Ruminococcus flavefaciens]